VWEMQARMAPQPAQVRAEMNPAPPTFRLLETMCLV
jgi:hypothetical protein